MKKIISIIIVFITIFGLFPFITQASSDAGYFVVTAYYSPLPDQEYYLKGNYEDEKRLNGEGIRGASGKEVFSGMLAGPKNYQFGTKIYLEGLGIGDIQDRGGAIVNAGNRGYSYDRIDVWMGYGDEGLRRALYWGKRTVKGSIVHKDSSVTLNYNNISSPQWVTEKLNKVELETVVNNDSYINSIKHLQNIFTQLGLYSGDIDGDYSKMKDIVAQYQLDNDVVKNDKDPGFGYYGPKTKESVALNYDKYLKNEEFKREVTTRFSEIEKEVDKKIEEKLASIGNIQYKEVSAGVREFQLSLQELGYFDYDDTAIFGSITFDSLVSYQIKKKIIQSEDDISAGVFGPKTREEFKKDLTKLYLKELVEAEDFSRDALVVLIENKNS